METIMKEYESPEDLEVRKANERFLHSMIFRDYPEFTKLKIAQVFLPTKGHIDWPLDCSILNLEKLKEIGVEAVNLQVTDKWGINHFPDYSINELFPPNPFQPGDEVYSILNDTVISYEVKNTTGCLCLIEVKESLYKLPGLKKQEYRCRHQLLRKGRRIP